KCAYLLPLVSDLPGSLNWLPIDELPVLDAVEPLAPGKSELPELPELPVRPELAELLDRLAVPEPPDAPDMLDEPMVPPCCCLRRCSRHSPKSLEKFA